MSLREKRDQFDRMVTNTIPLQGPRASKYVGPANANTPTGAMKTHRQRARGKNTLPRTDIPSLHNPTQISVSTEPEAHKINVSTNPPASPNSAL